jgi:hypothetical protein
MLVVIIIHERNFLQIPVFTENTSTCDRIYQEISCFGNLPTTEVLLFCFDRFKTYHIAYDQMNFLGELDETVCNRHV